MRVYLHPNTLSTIWTLVRKNSTMSLHRLAIEVARKEPIRVAEIEHELRWMVKRGELTLSPEGLVSIKE